MFDYAYGNFDAKFGYTLIAVTLVTTILWCIYAYRKGWF